MKVELEIWEIRKGKITQLKNTTTNEIYKINHKPRFIPPVKKHYIHSWIELNKFKTFNIDDFIKKYPQYNKKDYRKRLNHEISRMVVEKKWIQISNNMFKVKKYE